MNEKETSENCAQNEQLRVECALEATVCTWARSFDGHFNISCPTGERANGQFKPDSNHQTKWNFKFCPYCGRLIELSL